MIVTRILIIEDEDSYREALTFMLRKEGFDVSSAPDGATGLAEFDSSGADLVLLDLMMPGMTGMEVCRQLRQRGNVAIVMVTARDSEVDKVVGLELGADDYVTKPFSHRELVARIRAVLRRGQDQVLLPEVVEVDGVRIDVERHQVNVDGVDVRFALREFELLELLLRNAGRVMTRGQLIDRIWGSDYVGDTKTLDVHIKRLRSKIEKDPSNPERLITVRGLGYKYQG
nr:response regulator transcription factor [Tessaracoccus sp. OS52]